MPNNMAALNYATQYSQSLANAFPFVLNFGALYATPNNNRFRWTGAKTIEIPSITTTGRVDSDRDTIGFASRNYTNAWEPKTLTNQRKWSTLVHPMDIDQTNFVTTIANITRTMNETQKFPEMDAYTISKIYSDWAALGNVADTTELSTTNVLQVFDDLMLRMDNARVPVNGRLLYVTNEVKTMLKNAQIDANNTLGRNLDVESGPKGIDRRISRLDEVQVIPVPQILMKTLYNFTTGWVPASGAKQINMMLIHPLVVITPISYQFAQLDRPSALTEGKWVYFEESFEDVFILNKQSEGIQFNISASKTVSVTSEAGTAVGDTKITVSPAAAAGNSYVYKVGTTVTAPGVGDPCVTGYTAWDGTSDITAATGKKILVVEVDKYHRAVGSGIATVTSKES